MKKLKLSINKGILSKDQMKSIVGGSGMMSCVCGTSFFFHQTSDYHCPGHFNNYCTAMWHNYYHQSGSCQGICDGWGGGGYGG